MKLILTFLSLVACSWAEDLTFGADFPHKVIVETVPSHGEVKREAPDYCEIWFDGCNNCQRSAPGEPLACTAMACRINRVAYCKKAFDDTVSVAKERKWCDDSKRQLCKMLCMDPPHCLEGQCIMREDSCCKMTCKWPDTPSQIASTENESEGASALMNRGVTALFVFVGIGAVSFLVIRSRRRLVPASQQDSLGYQELQRD